MASNDRLEIGENHRRAISATLAMVDRTLCLFERWAKGQDVQSVLYKERNNLSPRQRVAILRIIRDIRRAIGEIHQSLQLTDDVEITVTTIRGHCSILWVALEELQARHLRRYGEPLPELGEYLDPRVQKLIRLLRKLSDTTME